jgi:chromosome segregation ATPase
LEKQVKRITFESNEKRESEGRLIHKLTEEIGFLKSKFREPGPTESSSEQQLKETLKALEGKFKEIREKYSGKSKAFEELEFEHQQVKNTVNNLKSEMQKLSESSMNDKKEMHKAEMVLFETRNKLTEATLHARDLEDKHKSIQNELEFDKGEIAKLEDALKQEKRKVVNLEREIEQNQYLNLSKDSHQTESIANITQQNVLLRDENTSLKQRLEKTMSENQARLTKDQKELQMLVKKVKEKETSQQDLEIRLDDLRKKLDFYKQKSECPERGKEMEDPRQRSLCVLKKLQEQMGALRQEQQLETLQIRGLLAAFSSEYPAQAAQVLLVMKARLREAMDQKGKPSAGSSGYNSKSLFQGLSFETSHQASKGDLHSQQASFSEVQAGLVSQVRKEEAGVRPFSLVNRALADQYRPSGRYVEEELDRRRHYREEVTQKKETRGAYEGRDLQYSPVSPFLRSPKQDLQPANVPPSHHQRAHISLHQPPKEKTTPMKQARPLDTDKENLNPCHSPYVMDAKLKQKLSLYGYSPIQQAKPQTVFSPYEKTYRADFQKIEKESELISERIKALRQNEQPRLFK